MMTTALAPGKEAKLPSLLDSLYGQVSGLQLSLGEGCSARGKVDDNFAGFLTFAYIPFL